MALLWSLVGYLLGSISFAYLAGRMWGGKDIRRHGTRSLGGSNVYEQVSRPAAVVVGLLDLAKGALVVWLGLRMGMDRAVALAGGVGAVVGHNWSLYLRFHGGRGIGTSVGALLPIFPLGSAWLLVALGVGAIRRNPEVILAGFAMLPILAWASDQPLATVWASVALLLLMVAKRLEANRAPLPVGRERWRVLARRLLLDRDIRDWQAWVRRPPGDSGVVH